MSALYPTGKIREKAVWRSFSLTIYDWILNTHSLFRRYFLVFLSAGFFRFYETGFYDLFPGIRRITALRKSSTNGKPTVPVQFLRTSPRDCGSDCRVQYKRRTRLRDNVERSSIGHAVPVQSDFDRFRQAGIFL